MLLYKFNMLTIFLSSDHIKGLVGTEEISKFPDNYAYAGVWGSTRWLDHVGERPILSVYSQTSLEEAISPGE